MSAPRLIRAGRALVAVCLVGGLAWGVLAAGVACVLQRLVAG